MQPVACSRRIEWANASIRKIWRLQSHYGPADRSKFCPSS